MDSVEKIFKIDLNFPKPTIVGLFGDTDSWGSLSTAEARENLSEMESHLKKLISSHAELRQQSLKATDTKKIEEDAEKQHSQILFLTEHIKKFKNYFKM